MAYSPPNTMAPRTPATIKNRKRLGIWQNGSSPGSVLVYGDAIVSRTAAAPIVDRGDGSVCGMRAVKPLMHLT